MNIAVNARHMMKDRLEGIGTVTHEVMKRIVEGHASDTFDYYFDRGFDHQFIHGENVNGHSFFPPARLPVLIRWWLNHPVKKHLLRHHHDVFFSPDGFVPLNLEIPKVSVVHDVAFLRNPMHITPAIRRFYDKWMPQFIHETDHIITVSQFSKRELMAGYGLSDDKVTVVYNGVSPDFRPLSNEKIADIRKLFFEGKPYFLYIGSIHPRKNILTLIRAFEIFKDKTNSDFQLVIVGRPSWYTREVFQSFNKSKWRDEIQMTGFVDAEAARNFIASAHALVYPSRYEGFGLPVVEAMASGTAVICSNVASIPEVAGDAALYFDPGSADELVTHLITIAEDEELRRKLIAAGCERIKKFSWDEAARSIYKVLERYKK
jgi:glycosyltransferase involved in cell wall biosynthesis